MRWVTKSHLHLDRVATPWLISRFVDPDADIQFIEWDQPTPYGEDLIPFGFPDVELSSHDERGTSFRKVLVRYELDDPALDLMERLIASGVADALGTEPPRAQTSDEAALGMALNKLGCGLGVAFDDDEHLATGMALYEGVYAWCQLQTLPAAVRAGAPAAMPERVPYLRRAVGRATEA